MHNGTLQYKVVALLLPIREVKGSDLGQETTILTEVLCSFSIERRGRVVNSPASHLGDPRFKSRPVDRLS
jgi:hypothetical protein